MHIPALNEIVRGAIGKDPEYPENPESLQYMILYPDDYEGHGIDPAGNVALLLNEENAQEVKSLAEEIIEKLDDT